MAVICEMPALALGGQYTAIFIGCTSGQVELPIKENSIKRMAKKFDVTGSQSRDVDDTVWEQSAPGARSMTISVKGNWFPGAAVVPPQIREGAYYLINGWYRRPGSLNVGDPGYGEQGVFFTDSADANLNMATGEVTFSAEFSSSGPVQKLGTP